MALSGGWGWSNGSTYTGRMRYLNADGDEQGYLFCIGTVRKKCSFLLLGKNNTSHALGQPCDRDAICARRLRYAGLCWELIKFVTVSGNEFEPVDP